MVDWQVKATSYHLRDLTTLLLVHRGRFIFVSRTRTKHPIQTHSHSHTHTNNAIESGEDLKCLKVSKDSRDQKITEAGRANVRAARI